MNDLSQSIRELNIIIRISEHILGTLDYEGVLQVISDGMSELLDIESAAIYMLEGDEELMLWATTPALDPSMPDELRRAALKEHPHVGEAIFSCLPQVLPDALEAELSTAEKAVVELRQLRSLLYLPFVSKGKATGVLILGTCRQKRIFSEHEIELGQTVANQLSVAIQNARLHNELVKYKDNLERQVAERTQALEAANEELRVMNQELKEQNDIVQIQKEELQNTLNHLKEAQSRLIESEKMASLGVLTAGVAHEINNPLNFIMGSYLGLNDFFTNDAPQYKDEVGILLNGLKIGLDRASGIVRGLNLFNRASDGFDEVCHIPSIIENCLVILSNKYKHRISIEKEFHDAAEIKGNVGKLHQVFINILMNAIQAIPDQGLIHIHVENQPSTVKVSISDNGKGIKKDDLARITDPFFTTKAPGEGTGLGLSITYNIIHEHKGTMSFESEENVGTTVVVILPQNMEV